MDSAKLSIVHFNSEDVIATSACTSDHSLGSGSFVGKITSIVGLDVNYDKYTDNGWPKGDIKDDGIFTYWESRTENKIFFAFTPEVGKTFYYDSSYMDSDPTVSTFYYECNGTHDNLVGGPNQ